VTALLAEAFKMVGVTEHDGPEDNPIILQWAASWGLRMSSRMIAKRGARFFERHAQPRKVPDCLPSIYLMWSMIYAKYGGRKGRRTPAWRHVVTWRGKREQQIGHVSFSWHLPKGTG
jgi:hypothetical protein